MSNAFALTPLLLLTHRSGALLCISPARTVGSSFSMRAERPGAFERRSLASMMQPDGEPPSTERPGPVVSVAVIQVRGLLSTEVSAWDCGFSDAYTGRGSIVDQAREADADPSVVGLVFDVLSPGGDAIGVGEAAQILATMREASSKPWGVFAREACSAAYWLSVASADEGLLMLAPSADVANVGCWMAHVDHSKANEDEGVKITYVSSPAGKVIGNPDEPLSDEALSRFQRGINETTDRFCAAVAEYRPGLTAAAVLALDGDVRRGQAAIDEGLADGIALSIESVVALVAARASHATPTQKGSDEMKPSSAILALLPESARGDDAAAEAHIISSLHLAADVMTGVGETDPVRARGKLARRFAAAGEADKLLAANGALAASTEETKRSRLLETAVADGRLRAGQVFRQTEGTDGKRARAWAPFAQQLLDKHDTSAELAAYLEDLPQLPSLGGGAPTIDEAVAAGLAETARDMHRGAQGMSAPTAALAKKNGIDPAQLALATAQLFPEIR